MIVTHGAHSGGYALYLQDGRIHWTYNFLGAQLHDDLERGSACARPVHGHADVHTDRTVPRRHRHRARRRPVAKGHIAQTTPVTYGIIGGFTVGYQRGTPVSPTYEPPFRLADGVLQRVVIEPDGKEYRDPPAEERAGVAMQ